MLKKFKRKINDALGMGVVVNRDGSSSKNVKPH
jgi:hypothetical protein